MFCREQAARFAEAYPTLQALGVDVIGIGNGTAAMARDFQQQFQVPFPLYTDPSRESFRVAGMQRAFGLNLGSVALARRAMAAGHRQGLNAGDPFQQGGVLLIERGGALRFAHADKMAGAHADLADVLAAARDL